jgi:hypothetical protein
MKNKSIILLIACVFNICAWNGTDQNTGSSIEIHEGNLAREGEEIEYYEYGKGYGTLDIDSMENIGDSVEIEGTDENGETRTFEMEK